MNIEIKEIENILEYDKVMFIENRIQNLLDALSDYGIYFSDLHGQLNNLQEDVLRKRAKYDIERLKKYNYNLL